MEVMEDSVPTFWIGHHDDKRQKRVLPELIQQAHSAGVRKKLYRFNHV